MAFGDVVQSVENSGASGGASATLSAATAANLLLYFSARSTAHSAGGAWGTPTGFTDGPQSPINSGNMGGAAWWKYAAGGETAISNSGTNENGNWRAAAVEIEGPFDPTPLDVSAENEASIASVVTSLASGTTGATSQNDEVAIAFWMFDQASNVDGTRTYTNSFVEVLFADDVSSAARAAIVVARLVLTSTGTQTCTYGVTDTGDEGYGGIMTFKKLVVAASKVQRLGALGVG